LLHWKVGARWGGIYVFSGANVDFIGARYQTALGIAVRHKHVDTTLALLEGFASLEEHPSLNTRLSFHAASGPLSALERLIEAGLDVSTQQARGPRLVMMAAAARMRGNVRALLRAGADVNATCKTSTVGGLTSFVGPGMKNIVVTLLASGFAFPDHPVYVDYGDVEDGDEYWM
jgi:hypothetical protein